MSDKTPETPESGIVDQMDEYCKIKGFVATGRKVAKTDIGRLAPHTCQCGREFAKLNFKANGYVWVPPHKADSPVES